MLNSPWPFSLRTRNGGAQRLFLSRMSRVVVADGFQDSAASLVHELLLPGRDALGRILNGADESLAVRHHVACDHFVAVQHLLARGPIVRKRQNRSKAAGQLLIMFNLLERVIRGSDYRAAVLGHPPGCFITIGERRTLRTAENSHNVLVLPALESFGDFAQRLFL